MSLENPPNSAAVNPFAGSEVAFAQRCPECGWDTGEHSSYCSLRPSLSCSFSTMDWYCALPGGHAGAHRSEDFS